MAEPFDISEPLATGTSVLEASAGTGKTWTLAAITAKLVAEGTELERLLLVTFTRAATSELRERIRTRLVSVGRGLDARAAGHAPAEEDVVVELLADCGADELAARRRRITRALADFDAATITTIHGFCIQRRMQEAQLLLLDGQLTIAQIAERVGYEHQSSFAAAFRAFSGMAAKDYRKQRAALVVPLKAGVC